MPSGPIVVFNLARIVISKVMRSDTLNTLHKFHFTATAIIAAADNHYWWPAINRQITGKWANCPTWQQLWRIHCPSSPMVELTVKIKVMEVLSADYLTMGSQHFLIMLDKTSTFLWAKKFLHLNTWNAIDILKVHGRPKLVLTDVGPQFRN